jgi:hypothetical protein
VLLSKLRINSEMHIKMDLKEIGFEKWDMGWIQLAEGRIQ